jgi:curved DNA-binding protein CbpA
MIKDYYFLLGLRRHAPLEEVKAAYRKLAAQYHPDKVASMGPEAEAEANAQMLELNEAIALLSDPLRREQYHEMLELIPEREPEAPHPFTFWSGAQGESAQAESLPATPSQPLPPLQEPKGGRSLMREEQGRALKAGLHELKLKWRERSPAGWQWRLAAGPVLVAYRHQENLSLLSVRSLRKAVEALYEQHKLALRPTAVIAFVSYAQLMDAQAVQEQLREATGSKRGWLKMVHPVLVLHQGKTQRSQLLGTPPPTAEAKRVLQYLLRSASG